MASKMILPVLLIFLSARLTESLYPGDLCGLPSGSTGVCTLLKNCEAVLQELKFRNSSYMTCGYSGFEPIVCCPRSTLETTIADGRGSIARQKCKEYSQYVYTMVYPPTLGYNHELVNVSQCRIQNDLLIGISRTANRMEFPHMAAIGYDSKTAGIGWYCSGTLISEKFVLTAAHCAYSSNWGDATWVRVGYLKLMRMDGRTQPTNHRIIERIKHPEYKAPSRYHDIALLRLETAVSFNGRIRPACLYTASSTGNDIQRAIATGWSNDNGERSNILRADALTLINTQTCNARRNSNVADITLSNGIVDNLLVCAEGMSAESCQGDSGAPLAIYSKKEHCMYDIIGVTNFGELCGKRTIGIYTRVYYYLSWIESIVWGQR